MDIFCHIVGLNNKFKNNIINILEKNNFKVIDLDILNDTLINDNHMNNLYKKYEEILKKNKLSKNSLELKKYKELDKEMTNYWKNQLYFLINEEIKNNLGKKMIIIGYNNHFNKNKIFIKIESKLKFFVKVNLEKNAKYIISNNINYYKEEIINGIFPLEYLDFNFLIKKREQMVNIYENIGYYHIPLITIFKIISSNKNFDINSINKLYYSSNFILNKKIKNKSKFISYTIPWISIISCLNNTNLIVSDNKTLKIYNKDIKILKQSKCYMYEVDKNHFYNHENNNKIEFVSNNDIKILENYYIENIYDYLIKNGVDIKIIKD